MALQEPQDRREVIPQTILRAIEKEIAVIVEQEAQAAAKRVELRVRENVAAISGRVLQHFSMEHRGPELVIRVNFDNTRPGV